MTGLLAAARGIPGRFAEALADQVASAVLFRDASRASRRWQTYASRLGFSAVLIGGLLLAIWTAVASPVADTAQLGWLGRGLFIGMATLQFGMALMLAPLGCAAALQEETEQGTLDLLVLTKMRSHQIASAKVLSRVLVLLTVVFGALPVMAAVVTIGGVSGTEVLAVTLHTALAVVVAGAMGALFALFTRSPLLAMLAAAGYAVPGYLVVPATYAICSMSPRAATHLSLLLGPAALGPDAFLPLLVHLPVLWLTWRVGTRLFALRTSRAHIQKAFSSELWEATRFGQALVVLLVITAVLVPLASLMLWTLRGTHSPFWPLTVAVQGVLFSWGAAVSWLVAWVYLRVGIDVVDAIDRTFGSSAREKRTSIRVWSNPVAWREARPRAWGPSAVPIQFTWLLGVLLVSQTVLWVIPGGLVGLGLFNLIAATVLTLWLSTWTIEHERRLGALEVLLTTTLPTWKVALGKAAGIVLPTAPLVVIALPMLVIGNVYAGAVFSNEDDALAWFGEGLGAWIWATGVWLAAIGLGMSAALVAGRKRSAFVLCLGGLSTVVGVPAAAGRLFPDVAWIAVPARLIAPPLAGSPTWWQITLSCMAVYALAAGVLGLTALNLRRWVAAAIALVVVVAAAPGAALAAPELQSNFQFTAHPIDDGLSREDHWTAVHVSIENHGSAATGVLSLDERPAYGDLTLPYQRTVELPEKSRKDVLLLVRPGVAGRTRTVNLNAGPTRSATAEVQWQSVVREGVIVAVLGDDPLGVTAIGQTWTGPTPGPAPKSASGDPRPVRAGLLDPRTLPRHSAAYDAIDQVVWHRADPSQLGARELDALLGWVAAGGHLTVTITDTWRQVNGSPLGPALPVELVGTAETTDLTSLFDALDVTGDPTVRTLQALATPRANPDRGAWVVAADAEGRGLWTIGSYGLGTITVLAVDPTTSPLANTDRIRLWRALLWLPEAGTQPSAWRWRLDRVRAVGGDPLAPPSLLAALRLWEPNGYDCVHSEIDLGWDGTERGLQWEQAIRDRLDDIPGASPLPLPWLIAFSIVYLIAIGPLDYLVLRWLKKEPWTWVTFPATVLVFSVVALVGTAYTKGSQAVVTRVEVVDVLPGTDQWRGHTSLGVFSTRKAQLSLAAGSPDGVVSPMRAPGSMWDPTLVTTEGPGSLVYRAETWSLAFARSTWVEGGHGAMHLVQSEGGPKLENQLGVDLAWVVLIDGDPTARTRSLRIAELGPLDAGDSVDVGEGAGWRFGAPSDGPVGDLTLAWEQLLDQPEPLGAHLHPSTWRWTVLAGAARPVEQVTLTGLAPVTQDFTVFRAPLGPPVAPGRPAWTEDEP